MKVIYDSDLLGDDFFTLKALADNEDIDILAVTAVGRITSALSRAKMAQVFLEDTKRKGIPIIPGASRPLIQEPKKGCMYCHQQMLGLLSRWNEDIEYSNKLITNISAAEYIVSLLKEENDVVLLSTGPLTNIALACSLDPLIVDKVKAIYLMGGVHFAKGNKSPVAESNIFNDVDAASIVFDRFKNIHVIPLDVTLKFVINEETASAIFDKFFRDVSLSCCLSHKDRGDESIMPMHDYLAYIAMIDDKALSYKPCDIKIDISGSLSRGKMCVDFNDNGKHLYAISFDEARCFEHYFNDFRGM